MTLPHRQPFYAIETVWFPADCTKVRAECRMVAAFTKMVESTGICVGYLPGALVSHQGDAAGRTPGSMEPPY